MIKYVTCDNCEHDFTITALGEIQKGDIAVQYFECPKCKTKYHVCTINTEMRRLIEQRAAIQNKIEENHKKKMPVGTAQKLQHELGKIITKQKKLMPKLKKCGEEILNGNPC